VSERITFDKLIIGSLEVFTIDTCSSMFTPRIQIYNGSNVLLSGYLFKLNAFNGCLKKPSNNQLWGSSVHIKRRKAY